MNSNFKLEKFTKKDFEYYFELVSDVNVMEMITERALENEEAKSDFNKIIINNQLDEILGSFKIIGKETDEFLGFAKLEIESKDSNTAELGYMVLPEHWGKGIAGTVAKELIEIAKSHPTIESLFAIIDPKNLPSRKILTNNGFVSVEFRDFDGLPGEILGLEVGKII